MKIFRDRRDNPQGVKFNALSRNGVRIEVRLTFGEMKHLVEQYESFKTLGLIPNKIGRIIEKVRKASNEND